MLFLDRTGLMADDEPALWKEAVMLSEEPETAYEGKVLLIKVIVLLAE